MKEIQQSYENSLHRLKEIIAAEQTVANRDSAIKRFEFTTELAWKMLQLFLREQGIVCRSPKECLREAFKYGLILDDARWLQMVEDRNLTVHTYNEILADDVCARIPSYIELFEMLLKNIQQKT